MKRFGSVAGYAFIAGMPAASNLLLTLVLVRALGISGFAVWAIVEPSLLIFGVLTALGTQYGVLFTTASGQADGRRALSVAITAVLPVSFAAASAMWLVLREQIEGLGYFNLVLPLVGEAMGIIIVNSFRAQRLLAFWIAFESMRTLGTLLCCAALAWLAPDMLRTVNQVLLIRGGLTAVAVLMVVVGLRLRPIADLRLLIRMMRYGLPTAGAAMMQQVLTNADRYLLALLGIAAAEIALYAAHQRLAGLISVLAVTPLNLWFATEAIRRDTAEHGEFFRTVLVGVMALLSVFITGAFLIGPILWPYFFPEIDFRPFVFALLAAAVIPQAVGIVLNIGPLREKKTHLGAIAVALSGVAMAIAGPPLIRFMGASGAALSRLIALAVNAIAGRIFSEKVAPVTHFLRPLILFVIAMGLATFMLFSPTLGLPVWPGLVATVAVIAWGLYANRVRFLELARGKGAVDRGG